MKRKCDVCGGVLFVKAAPVSELFTTAKGERRVALWGHAVIVPCPCGGRR